VMRMVPRDTDTQWAVPEPLIFAMIAPNDGFSYGGFVHEGFPDAQDIGAAGYNTFVLLYPAGHGGWVATEDLGCVSA
jgi:hypothetical protein